MNRRAALFVLFYLAAILYLSLYPWHFVPNLVPRTLRWVPLATRRTLLDAVLNLVFYIPLGAAALLSFRKRDAFAFMAALAVGTLLSSTMEKAQLSIPGRFGNLDDLFCNSVGTLLGAAIAALATSSALASRLKLLCSPRALLLGLWAVWQAFTFFLPRNYSVMDASHETVGLLILVLLAARWRIRAAPLLLLIWLALDELRPLQFHGPPQQLWWLPFESWFVGAPESYYGTFFGKLFLYTAILWVERRSGIRWIWALAAPGAILAAGEFAQRYLPGRTPELTDLVLLAAGAGLLQLVEAPIERPAGTLR